MSTGQTTTRRELKVVQDDIKELRSQVSGAGSSSGAALRRPARLSGVRPGGGSQASGGGTSLAWHL